MARKTFSSHSPAVLGKLHEAALEAQKSGRFIEASLLVFASMDALLRSAIAHKLMLVHGEDAKKYLKYWNDPQTPFARLIDNAELLGIGAGRHLVSVIENLRSYNRERNDIVHGFIYASDLDEIFNLAKQHYFDGVVIEAKLLADMGEELCLCGSGKLFKECDCGTYTAMPSYVADFF